jgi:transcriptional regulator of acetoin/glycerol metabolism
MARPIKAGAGDRQTESSHADLISRVVEGQESDPQTGVVDSWRRSLTQHHVEPAAASAPNVLTERELKDLREQPLPTPCWDDPGSRPLGAALN